MTFFTDDDGVCVLDAGMPRLGPNGRKTALLISQRLSMLSKATSGKSMMDG